VPADRGYDHDKHRRLVRDLGVKPQIAHRGTEHGSGLGTRRWGVERTFDPCTGSAARASAGRYATTSTKPSSPALAASPAGDG
jgi:transposase